VFFGCLDFFLRMESCFLFPQGWFQTTILQMSASWVAGITSLSHYLAMKTQFLYVLVQQFA
jgi:hypothetical protein